MRVNMTGARGRTCRKLARSTITRFAVGLLAVAAQAGQGSRSAQIVGPIPISMAAQVQTGSLVAWGGTGDWDKGQTQVPAGDDYVALAGGMYHSLALRSNGSLVAWGDNAYGQCDVPWGNDFVAIEAGFLHSVALRSNGTLAAWGDNADGQCNVPEGSDYVAVAAGADHCLAVKADGSVVAWGNNQFGQCNVPAGLTCCAVAAGWRHSLALTLQGSLVAWGSNVEGESDVPAGTDFVAIACGDHHNFAQRADGSLVAWGSPRNGRTILPPGTEFPRAFSGGGHHSLVLKADGSLIAWGECGMGKCDCPPGNDYIAIAAGTHHNLAIVTADPAARATRIAPEYVTVGNPGNPDDTHMSLTGDTFGGVSYIYRMGKYEVTAAQYCAFLNAVAADDPYGLYDPAMMRTDASTGCQIRRERQPGSYIYSVPADWANRPVNFVNFWDACRFANWLHNGQAAGPRDANSTEDGAYTLNGYTGSEGREIVRHPGARVWIPSADEWYKAAYHKNDGATGHYWDYPTSSDQEPGNDLKDPDPGNNANFKSWRQRDLTLGPPYWRTEVGEFENSRSPYGTYDQAGNVREWTDALRDPSQSLRIQHGASYGTQAENFAGDMGNHGDRPEVGMPTIGFRVAAAGVTGDISGRAGTVDGVVDFMDFAALACVWQTGRAVAMWNTECDIAPDGRIDFLDLHLLAGNWLTGAGD